MASTGAAGDESNKPSGRDLLAEALANPPHETRWEVTTDERVEVHDQTGALFAFASLKGGSVKDAGGRLLVTFVPGAKQIFSLSNVIGSAIPGIFGSDAPPWRARGPIEAPPLNLRYVPASLPFAQVQLEADGTSRVELLPHGRLNDKVINRALAPAVVARFRARSPLLYQHGQINLVELSDPQGRVLARAPGAADAHEAKAESNWSIEVVDNDLPSVWLFAILLGCRRWHR